ncbi:MAG: hypothetical protein R6U13_01225 [Desulfatiglandaceae bacterium]
MRDLVSLFRKHDVEYAVCGGYAVAYYGFVRMTLDFDLLVLPTHRNAARIMRALDEFGFGDAGLAEETFTREAVAVTLGEQPNQIDILTSIGSQPARDVLSNARLVEIEGMQMPIVDYKDLVKAKKESGRAKDLADVEELECLRSHGEGC